MMAFALQNEGEVKPKDQDGTERLKGQSRGVCGCFNLTALIWVSSTGECETWSTAGSWFDSNLIHQQSI